MNTINVSYYSPNPVKIDFFFCLVPLVKWGNITLCERIGTLRMDRDITDLKFQSYTLLVLVFVVQELKNPF